MCFISLFQIELPFQTFFAIVCFVCPYIYFPNIVNFDKPCPISMQGYMEIVPNLNLYTLKPVLSGL